MLYYTYKQSDLLVLNAVDITIGATSSTVENTTNKK